MTTSYPLRSIRSYVRRQGRITPGQANALIHYWDHYCLEFNSETAIDWQNLFPRQAPCILEIGFGMGTLLVAMAKQYPDKNFIGVEVHRPGIGQCINQAQREGVSNLKIFAGDALLVLEQIPNQSLEKVLLLFPDPWPKTRHHKRRIVQPAFVKLVAEKLLVGGQFHLATDWQPYAAHMINVLNQCPALKNCFGAENFATDLERPATKFERRGQKLGHDIWELLYTQINP